MGKKILYTATVLGHIQTFHTPFLKMCQEMGYETAVAARNENAEREVNIPFCDTYYDVPFERLPFRPNNIRAFRALKKIITDGNFDMIHCHTPVGAMLTRLAAGKARKTGTRVVYTAHGFHFYRGAPLKYWLMYFPVEWLLSFVTDELICINREDYTFAKKYFHAKRITYVPGVGINTDRFGAEITQEERDNFRRELGVEEDGTLLCSVGELNPNKNHQLVIRALAKLQNEKVHYCIAGEGGKREMLTELAEELGVAKQVHLLGYCQDVNLVYRSADIFCFPSYREGLPVSLMEAMYCGLPVIASDIRGIRDLLGHRAAGAIQPDNVDHLAEVLRRFYKKPEWLTELQEDARSALCCFFLDNVLNCVRAVYETSPQQDEEAEPVMS